VALVNETAGAEVQKKKKKIKKKNKKKKKKNKKNMVKGEDPIGKRFHQGKVQKEKTAIRF
jgi:hypothetical protein